MAAAYVKGLQSEGVSAGDFSLSIIMLVYLMIPLLFSHQALRWK